MRSLSARIARRANLGEIAGVPYVRAGHKKSLVCYHSRSRSTASTCRIRIFYYLHLHLHLLHSIFTVELIIFSFGLLISCLDYTCT
jgi:hypothetical protein